MWFHVIWSCVSMSRICFVGFGLVVCWCCFNVFCMCSIGSVSSDTKCHNKPNLWMCRALDVFHVAWWVHMVWHLNRWYVFKCDSMEFDFVFTVRSTFRIWCGRVVIIHYSLFCNTRLSISLRAENYLPKVINRRNNSRSEWNFFLCPWQPMRVKNRADF